MYLWMYKPLGKGLVEKEQSGQKVCGQKTKGKKKNGTQQLS